MPPPARLVQWLRREYPKPNISPSWLEDCYAWIDEQQNLNPATDMDAIIESVDQQLLLSNLSDSMVPGTGLPEIPDDLVKHVISGPILVEITSITEVGHSALSLLDIRQTRIERENAAVIGDGEEEEPISNYPRSMLSFELSDGSRTLRAFEYARLPGIELGETPLGYKMLIKDVFVYHGTAFLQPINVTPKGFQTEERELMQDADFVRGLRLRIGLPPDDPAAPAPVALPVVGNGPQINPPHPPPVAPVPAPAPSPAAQRAAMPAVGRIPSQPTDHANVVRSPLRQRSDPPEPPAAGPSHTSYDDDAQQPRRRKIPVRNRTPSPPPPPRSRPINSRYFSDTGRTSGSTDKGKQKASDLARDLMFSPHRHMPIVVGDSDEELEDGGEESVGLKPHIRAPAFNGGKGKEPVVMVKVHCDPDVEMEDDPGNASPRSSIEYDDFDFAMDAMAMAEADRVEEEYSHAEVSAARTGTQTQSQTQRTQTQQTQTQTQTDRTLVGSSRTGTGVTVSTQATLVAGRNPQSSRRGGGSSQPRPAPIDLGPIEIDDEEEDEKENVPAPTRHVRRRTEQENDYDVIEISD